MAPSVAVIVRGHQRTTKTTTGSTGGLLAVHGIQSRTIGLELAWGRTPAKVPCIFFVFLIFTFIFYIYLLASKKILKKIKNTKKKIKTPKIFIPLSYMFKECLASPK